MIAKVFVFLVLLQASNAISPGVHTRIRGARVSTSTVRPLDDSTLANTEYGPVQGKAGPGYVEWLGIPFAAPPTGSLRWKAPQAPQSWSTPLQTTSYSAGCPQNCVLPKEMCPDTTSEDCLYLNVYAPITPANTTQLQPVMVFLAGGAFVQGTGNGGSYSGAFLAQRDGIVTVTTNYRLGALGWLASPSNGLKGNFGLFDQRFALEWVQRNIRNFGGDPNQVTLVGQSAGAASTAYHMISPKSEGLFHRAILESHPWGLPIKTLDEYEKAYSKLAKKLDCDSLACLQGKSATDITNAADDVQIIPNPFSFTLNVALTWTPVIDGIEILEQPIAMWQDGAQSRVPFMIGTTTNEGDMFIRTILKKPLLSPLYSALVPILFNLKTLGQYPPSGHLGGDRNRESLSQIATDYIFHCSARAVSQDAAIQGQDVYFYHFDHVLSFQGVWGDRYSYCENLVCHGSELPFVFGTPSLDGYQFTPDEATLSDTMMDYWTNFVKSGDPNSPRQMATQWPKYHNDGGDNELLLSTKGVSVQTDYDTDNCNFWDAQGYAF